MCPASFDRRSKSKARERADLGASRLDLPGVEQVGDSMWLSLLGGSPGSSGPGGGVSDSRDHLFCALDKPLPSSRPQSPTPHNGAPWPIWVVRDGGRRAVQRLGRRGE